MFPQKGRFRFAKAMVMLMKKNKVTVWNEFVHEKNPAIAAIYPNGIHGQVAAQLSQCEDLEVRTATLEMPENGLPDDVLNDTDVLFWWGHMAHGKVPDELAEKIRNRVVNDGMGFVALHSGHASKPFKLLMGTGCRLKWRESGDRERLWVIDPTHPIADGLPDTFALPHEETYGERFDIPTPDDVVLASWFTGGEIFRSGCCFRRGRGKIFYFRPGHESFPTFYDENVGKVLRNAAHWAAPVAMPDAVLGKVEALEPAKEN